MHGSVAGGFAWAVAVVLGLAGDPPPIQRPAGPPPGSVQPAAPPRAIQIEPRRPSPPPADPIVDAPPPDDVAPAGPIDPRRESDADATPPEPTTIDDRDADPAIDPVRDDRPRAPYPPRSLVSAPAPGSSRQEAGALRRQHDADSKIPHKGAILEAQIGSMGCVRALCSDGRHAVSPGIRINGFLGGNIRGFVELGIGGGWGQMRSRAPEGTNALTMYGLDPGLLQQALYAQAAGLINVNLYGLSVTDAKMSSGNVGPVVRVHLIPRGRVAAWLGSGAGYHLLRNKYETAVGSIKLDFHGLAVPIEAGLGVFVHENVALTAQFDYLWTWYGLAVLDHPDQRAALPVAALQTAAGLQGVDLRAELPQFWTVGFGIRGRI